MISEHSSCQPVSISSANLEDGTPKDPSIRPSNYTSVEYSAFRMRPLPQAITDKTSRQLPSEPLAHPSGPAGAAALTQSSSSSSIPPLGTRPPPAAATAATLPQQAGQSGSAVDRHSKADTDGSSSGAGSAGAAGTVADASRAGFLRGSARRLSGSLRRLWNAATQKKSATQMRDESPSVSSFSCLSLIFHSFVLSCNKHVVIAI